MFPPDTGGAERYAYELAQALGRRGHDVDVYTATTTSEQVETHRNVTVTRLFRRRRIPIVETIYYGLRTRQIIDFDAYDVVHGTLMPASTVGLFPDSSISDTPVVVTCHLSAFDTMISLQPDTVIDYLMKYVVHPTNTAFDIFSGQMADHTIAISDQMHKRLVKTYRIPDNKTTTILHGVDVDKFTPNVSPHSAVNPDQLTLLTVSRLAPEKGIELAIKGIAEISNHNPELLIAGTGRHEERLRGLADDLDVSDQVRFLGYVPDDELPSLYATADIFTLTSRHEGFGLVLLEAMACGTPVVATDVGGIPSVVQDEETGYLIPREERAFAECVGQLADAELRDQMGANARSYAEANSWDKIAEQVEKIYHSYQSCSTV